MGLGWVIVTDVVALKLETPIVILTTMRIESIELEAFHLGATDFITKPFSPQVLAARIEKILNKLSKEVFQEVR